MVPDPWQVNRYLIAYQNLISENNILKKNYNDMIKM